MSKKLHDYYYTYTSPSSSAVPSAPPEEAGSSSLPSYDDAIKPYDLNSQEPPAKRPLAGFVRDATIISFDPPSSDDPGEGNSSTDPLLANEEENPYRGRPPPPNYSIYHAPFYRTTEEVISRDDHLNRDGEALLQFLNEHNTVPGMAVHFYGYHEETHWRRRTTRDSDGNITEESEPVTQRVDDFTFDVDCSQDIIPICQGIYVLPDKKTGLVKAVRALCDEYVHEKNKLKELQLTKVVNWNYPELTKAFTAAIRAHGYTSTVEISYRMKSHKVIVKTSSWISRTSDNRVVQVLLFISCLWIIVWPIIWFCKKKFGHTTLKSEWIMSVSERDWYQRHIHEVLGQVRKENAYNVPFIL
ncbi:hypothetical protein J3Q64DRAFT_1727548 [Phycomyces blakesleeanus]|uniref:Uncharacterized protein n=2 Tax=Phycomyces blakesleeanus TaxID=4837 RepID=A0A162PMD2_PHYB8|nr:hypothetical protein PHYBLDRAFT_159639 [Phycomyces blakesleeanus NRRL 1555(-)]OAD70296.1 hypothetical protein PHYBLDRAFT_159639 [Phycomyces blakesleeanus NRRL 1555(-)]|eukprot:XP_018288336.1 hypothetical protein PHYBLDRAFT_159639 [Phycomyces blakesleeanus NRRL 1555(-)]